MKVKKFLIYCGAFLVLASFTLLNFSIFAKVKTGSENIYGELKKLTETMRIISENYVEEKSEIDLIDGAIKGMLRSLDPFSSYLDARDFKEMQIETKGEYGGLGIEITIHNGFLTVVAPIEDTPAFRAGIKAGDIILKIDGEPTKDMSLSEAVDRMRGKPHTKVVLTIAREGEEKPFDVEIVRDVIRIRSVKSFLLKDSILYIRLKQFQQNASKEIKDALDKYGFTKNDQMSPAYLPEKGVILDLRNNPGGLLIEAIKVGDLFLDEGTIVYTKDRKGVRDVFEAKNDGFERGFQLIVLMNRGSASASEIVSGALKDHERALIIGEKSFGKASVQTIFPLEDNDAIRLTTAYYYTPSGKLIHNKGIEPDIEFKTDSSTKEEFEKRIKMTFEERVKSDPVVKKAVELLETWRIFIKKKNTQSFITGNK